MYKTISINISGIIFNVNEDAYEILKNYLDELHSHFSKTDEGKEVYADIESRIAEIFSEIITINNQVITIKDVNNLIETLGKPEDFFEEEIHEEDTYKKYKKNTKKKRLYRDTKDNMIAGVSSGLSYYFGIERVIFRIIFILLFAFGGSGLWIYIILWIAIPEARTRSQKLEMKGEPINISNIEENIKNEYEKVKKNIKNKNIEKEVKNFFEKIVHVITTVIKGIFKAFGKLIGLFFVIFGVAILSVIVGSYIFDNTLIQINDYGITTFSFTEALKLFTSSSNINYLIFSLLIIITIPILGVLYAGIKLLLNIKTSNRIIPLIGFIIWIFGIVIFTASSIDIGKNFTRGKSIETKTILKNNSDTIHFAKNSVTDSINGKNIIFSNDDDDFLITNNSVYISPSFSIIDSDSDSIIVKIKRKARGNNKNNAKQNLEKIIYNWNFNNDTLNFDSHLLINNEYRGQEIKIKIYKPKNITITGIDYDDFY